jgi:hypothetical protein
MVVARDVERDVDAGTLPIPMLLHQSTAQRRHEHMELGTAKQNKTPIQISKQMQDRIIAERNAETSG